VPPGRRNPRSYGRRRADRWLQPRAGERTRLSNTPSKVISSTVPVRRLPEAWLSTDSTGLPVDKNCGLQTQKYPRSFSSAQPVDRVSPVHEDSPVF
jgi:hypothetical protein